MNVTDIYRKISHTLKELTEISVLSYKTIYNRIHRNKKIIMSKNYILL